MECNGMATAFSLSLKSNLIVIVTYDAERGQIFVDESSMMPSESQREENLRSQ